MDEKFADAVVVAAGASRRMHGIDKLDADVDGRPLLAWSVERMAAARSVRRVILVAAPERVANFAEADWLRATGATVVAGGAERTDSVLAGVRASDADVVLIHDGARPLATPELADAVATAAAEHGAAVPVIPVADSLKQTAGGLVTGAVSRDGLVAAQTPQGARRSLLLAAAAAQPGQMFTDEAGLLAAHGVDVATVAGEVANFKVTRADDLELVRAIAAGGAGSLLTRTGYGYDSHQFGPADGLWLGGVLIDAAPRLRGHSDGDAALHAVASALLSAGGLGDIGRLFPAGAPDTAGTASTKLLRSTVEKLAAAGWRPASVAIGIAGARPRLGAQRIDEMRESIAAALDIDPAEVAVTASTGNLTGAEGMGLSISATAVATLVRA